MQIVRNKFEYDKSPKLIIDGQLRDGIAIKLEKYTGARVNYLLSKYSCFRNFNEMQSTYILSRRTIEDDQDSI